MPNDNLDGLNPCHEHACALQACMQRTWDQEKCQNNLTRLYSCCNQFYKKFLPQNPNAQTDACPLPDVTRKKLQKQGEQVLF